MCRSLNGGDTQARQERDRLCPSVVLAPVQVLNPCSQHCRPAVPAAGSRSHHGLAPFPVCSHATPVDWSLMALGTLGAMANGEWQQLYSPHSCQAAIRGNEDPVIGAGACRLRHAAVCPGVWQLHRRLHGSGRHVRGDSSSHQVCIPGPGRLCCLLPASSVLDTHRQQAGRQHAHGIPQIRHEAGRGVL